MKTSALTAATMVLSLCVTIQAHAMRINGSLSVAGAFQPIDSSGSTTALEDATGIDFAEYNPGDGGNFFVTATFGDFGSLRPGTMGIIQDFQFDPFSPPIYGFWTVGDFSFDLKSINVNSHEETSLVLTGTGTISIQHDVLDSTPGEWTLTGDTTRDEMTFSWSSTTSGTSEPGPLATPEPGTLVLVSTGIAGIGLRYKRHKRVQSQAA